MAPLPLPPPHALATWPAEFVGAWAASHGAAFEPYRSACIENCIAGDMVADRISSERKDVDAFWEAVGVQSPLHRERLWRAMNQSQQQAQKQQQQQQQQQQSPSAVRVTPSESAFVESSNPPRPGASGGATAAAASPQPPSPRQLSPRRTNSLPAAAARQIDHGLGGGMYM